MLCSEVTVFRLLLGMIRLIVLNAAMLPDRSITVALLVRYPNPCI